MRLKHSHIKRTTEKKQKERRKNKLQQKKTLSESSFCLIKLEKEITHISRNQPFSPQNHPNSLTKLSLYVIK